MLTTNQKGAIAELAIAREALKLGIGVYAPYGDERTDLIFDLHPRLVRVQCKWASRKDDIVVVRLYAARQPARNNQSSGVRWARDYEFGATLTPLLGP
jgi:hypothetical protein